MQHTRTRWNFCNTKQYFSGINLCAIEKYTNLPHIFFNITWINNYNNCRKSQYDEAMWHLAVFYLILCNINVDMIEKCTTSHVISLNIFWKNKNRWRISQNFPIFMPGSNIYSTKIIECFGKVKYFDFTFFVGQYEALWQAFRQTTVRKLMTQKRAVPEKLVIVM